MRIDFHHEPQSIHDAGSTSTQKPSAAASTEVQLGNDEARLSDSAQIQAIAVKVMQLHELRSERVQALRQAISSGRFQPEPVQIAGAMLTEAAFARMS